MHTALHYELKHKKTVIIYDGMDAFLIMISNVILMAQKVLRHSLAPPNVNTLDILFSSNHNIHKSSCGLCFWASDPLIKRF